MCVNRYYAKKIGAISYLCQKIRCHTKFWRKVLRNIRGQFMSFMSFISLFIPTLGGRTIVVNFGLYKKTIVAFVFNCLIYCSEWNRKNKYKPIIMKIFKFECCCYITNLSQKYIMTISTLVKCTCIVLLSVNNLYCYVQLIVYTKLLEICLNSL
jgi:hypothetical protein